jgi:hypothetical protein
VADAKIGAATLVYSTSEVMTQAAIGGRDVGVLYGRAGSDGETALAFKTKPQIKVLDGQATTSWSKGILRINYQHHGLLRLLIEGGERPLLLLIGENSATDRIWRQDTAQGPVLLLGSHLLRSAHAEGDTLALTGDGDADNHAEVLAGQAQRITWNGGPVQVAPTPSGTLAFDLPVPKALTLPALDHWTSREDQPETSPAFDDKGWKQADLTASSSVTKPGSLPVLFADDYGFHTGNTWYRGHFSGKAAPSGIKLNVKSGGPAGAFSVWLNGHFLGSVTSNETGAFSFPANLVVAGTMSSRCSPSIWGMRRITTPPARTARRAASSPPCRWGRAPMPSAGAFRARSPGRMPCAGPTIWAACMASAKAGRPAMTPPDGPRPACPPTPQPPASAGIAAM